jgi:hypothetical protein
MIAPTKIYDRFPTLSPAEAAEMIADAIRKRPKRVATTLGNLGQLSYAVAPGAQDLVVNRAYKLFPEGDRPRDDKDGKDAKDGKDGKPDLKQHQEPEPEGDMDTPERRAFVRATRGVHW